MLIGFFLTYIAKSLTHPLLVLVIASAAKSPQRFGRLCDYQVIRGIVLQTIVHKINNLNEIDILTKTVAHLISAQGREVGSWQRV